MYIDTQDIGFIPDVFLFCYKEMLYKLWVKNYQNIVDFII